MGERKKSGLANVSLPCLLRFAVITWDPRFEISTVLLFSDVEEVHENLGRGEDDVLSMPPRGDVRSTHPTFNVSTNYNAIPLLA
jgi:hypothetical protein